MVAASSSSVYGDGGTFPRTETQMPNPISPYAVAKLAGERFCVTFNRVYGLETVALRYFNVFGTSQDPDSQYAAVVPLFIGAIADGRAVTVFGDGEQSRDFTYVDNVVDANLLAADAPGAAGAVLNVATGAPETVNALADTVGRLLAKPVERVYQPERAADVHTSWADITAARETIGYEPRIGIEEGLRATIASLLAERSRGSDEGR